MSSTLSIILPCLNEAVSLPRVLEETRSVFPEAEIIVVDNGSIDNTLSVARSFGVRTIEVKERGYGAALRGGLAAATGEILCYMDGDGSYDPSAFLTLLPFLDGTHQMIFGDRLSGTMEKGAMPFLHRYVGTPLLTLFLSLVMKQWIGDVNAGQRCLTRGLYERMHLTTSGMECASQIFLEAQRCGAHIRGVPTVYRRDLRQGPSHLSPLRDGWRHVCCIAQYVFRIKNT